MTVVQEVLTGRRCRTRCRHRGRRSTADRRRRRRSRGCRSRRTDCREWLLRPRLGGLAAVVTPSTAGEQAFVGVGVDIGHRPLPQLRLQLGWLREAGSSSSAKLGFGVVEGCPIVGEAPPRRQKHRHLRRRPTRPHDRAAGSSEPDEERSPEDSVKMPSLAPSSPAVADGVACIVVVAPTGGGGHGQGGDASPRRAGQIHAATVLKDAENSCLALHGARTTAPGATEPSSSAIRVTIPMT